MWLYANIKLSDNGILDILIILKHRIGLNTLQAK